MQTEETERRDEFFQPQRQRLEHMAFRAVRKGLKPEEFVTVAIQVDDPSWTDLVEFLMPDATQDHWQTFRDNGQVPVARGTVRSEIIEGICEMVPDIAPALIEPLPAGLVRAIVMAYGGASVYQIAPSPHFDDN